MTKRFRRPFRLVLPLLGVGAVILLVYPFCALDAQEPRFTVLDAHAPLIDRPAHGSATEVEARENTKSLGITYEAFVEMFYPRIASFVREDELSEAELTPGDSGTFRFYRSVGDVAELYGVVRAEDDALIELGVLFPVPNGGHSSNHPSIEVARIAAEVANPLAPAVESEKAVVTAVHYAIKHSNTQEPCEKRVGDVAYEAQVVNAIGVNGDWVSLALYPK
ncbi:hypothetical protein C2O23_21350 [Salmonella enterica]|nr:hypothetical protein [Salmonella enterica]HCX7090158.1 hypothetical protein [Salmonella enterica subsp. enterica]